jgi:hypothetical protein
MAKTKKQNSTQVPNGGYSISGYGAVPPTYSTTYPVTGSGYSNVTISGATGLNYSTATTASWYTQQPKVKITDSDIELDGLSMRQTLLDLQSRLAIMTPNPKLEQEFEELRECADRYRELEKKFLEQKAIWETLKRTDNK